MNRCTIGSEGSICLAWALEKNSTVTDLDLSDNPIKLAVAVAFAVLLTMNVSLSELSMNRCGTEGGVLAISSSLRGISV